MANNFITANFSQPEINNRVFDCKEAAEILRVPLSTVWKWVRTGKLPHRRYSRKHIRFTEADLNAFFNSTAR